jgi:hypothetical protein
VHHELITKRSGFFRAARSEMSTLAKSKPTYLPKHDPKIFAHYLHCVYRDAVPFFDWWEDGDDDNASYTMDVICTESDFADYYYEYLVKLYTTADSLQDPITANMAIDEVRRISQKARRPQSDALDHAFDHTSPGDNMRKVLADIYIFSGDGDLDDIDYPADFLKLVVERFTAMREKNSKVGGAAKKVARKTLWALGDDVSGHQARREYHQETESDSELKEDEEMEGDGGAEEDEEKDSK